MISSDGPLELSPTRKLRELLALLMRRGRNDAYLVLDASALNLGGGQMLSGPITNGVWRTDQKIDAVSATDLPEGDVSINLRALPEAWPAIKSVFGETGLMSLPSEAPSAIAWRVSSDAPLSMELRFESGVPSSTRAHFAAATGVYSIRRTTLPDKNVIEELDLPLDPTASTTVGTEPTNTYRLIVTTSSLRLAEADAASSTPQTSCSNSKPFLRLKTTAIKSILTRLLLPNNFIFQYLEAAENQGKMIICVK
jgi:hypothetical protein